MKYFGVFVSGAVAVQVEDSAYNHINKVCADMTTQFTQEKKDSEVLLSKETAQFQGEIKNLNTEISQQTDNQEAATSAHDACAAKQQASASLAAELQTAIDTLSADIEKATQVNQIESKECAEKSSEFGTTAESLRLARTKLTSQHKNLSFAQIQALVKNMKQEPAQAIVKNYESGLQPLIELVDKLLEDTSQSKQDHDTACSNNKHNFQLMKQDLTNEVAQKTEAHGTAKNDEAVSTECAAAEQQTADEATAALNTATEMLTKTKAEKKRKTEELNQEISDLASTLDGLSTVTDLLTNVKAGAGNLATVPGVFLVQLYSAPNEKVSAFLTRRSKELNAPALSVLASKLSTVSSFDNVKNMIKELIDSLQKQSLEDTSMNDLCTGEQEKNEHRYNELNTEADAQSTNHQQFTAEIQLLSDNIAKLEQQITTLTQEQQVADENRNAEATENKRIIAEGNTAVNALEEIQTVIQDKVTNEAAQHNLLTIFKDMHSNIESLVSETEFSEDDSSESHKDETRDRGTAIKTHTQTKLNTDGNLKKTQGSLQGAIEKLDIAKHELKIQEKIQAATAQKCNPQQTHEQKMADMQEQIESLKEALQIIQNS